MDNQIKIKGKYRPEIDGLRAFAVVAVIINHFNKDLLPNGYLGVDIFFVISGYVITLSLANKDNVTLLDFISGFYERRIKRLVPALIAFVLISSLLICLFISDTGTLLKTGVSSLFGLSNLYLYKISTDYFAQEAELNIFTHTWSLGVEEQFYFLFPFLIWFTGFSKKAKKAYRNLFISILFLTICSLIGFISLYKTNQPAAYFLMPTRFWEMATGCMLFLGIKKQVNIIERLKNISPFFILIAIIFIMFLPISTAVPSTISIVILSAILIICLEKDTFLFNFFTNSKVVHIGLISYSIYLWHWGVLSISRWTIGIHWWSIPFQILAIYLLAISSYKFVELPIRKKSLGIKRYLSISIGLISLLLSYLVLFLLSNPLRDKLFLGDKNRINNYSENELWNRSLCNNIALNKNDTFDIKYFDRCWFKSKSNSVFNKTKEQKIYFYGNSYNEQLMPIPAILIQKRKYIKFNSFFTNKCVVSRRIRSDSELFKNCDQVFQRYINYFNTTSKEGDILVISNSYHQFFYPKTKFLVSGEKVPQGKIIEEYMNEFKDLSIKMTAQGKKLVVTSPIPIINKNPAICGNWYAKFNNHCIYGDLYDNQTNEKLSKLANNFMSLKRYGVTYLNIYDLLEKIFEDDKPNIFIYFFNNTHLSRIGALELTDYFENIVLNIHKKNKSKILNQT